MPICDQTCRGLLYGGQVEWVRIIYTERSSCEPDTGKIVIAELAPAQECHALHDSWIDETPCIVLRPDNGLQADLSLSVVRSIWHNSEEDDIEERFIQTTRAKLNKAASQQVVYKHHAFEYSAPIGILTSIPTMRGNQGASSGLVYVRRSYKIAPAAINAAFSKLGVPITQTVRDTLPLAYPLTPPTPAENVMVSSLIYLPEDTRLFVTKDILNYWIGGLFKASSLSASDAEILCWLRAHSSYVETRRIDDLVNHHGDLSGTHVDCWGPDTVNP